MGCSSSKPRLEEEEAVRACHERRGFVKKAVAQRHLLASSHVAYLQSLRRVSLALFYYLAEDEHLYFLQQQQQQDPSPAGLLCRHRPCSPDTKKVSRLVVNCLRQSQGGAPVHPLVVEQYWDEEDEGAQNAVVDGFFFGPLPVNDVPDSSSPSPPPPGWDLFWADPFSSLPGRDRDANYGVQVEEEKDDDHEEGDEEEMPELEEATDDDDDGGGGSSEDEEGESEEEEEEEAAEGGVLKKKPMEEEEEKKEKVVVGVINELRVMAGAEVEQQSAPGHFTVYVDRPPASVAEAMRDIQGHFAKVADTAAEVSVLLEVVPYKRKVRPPAPPRGDVEDGGEGDGGEQGAGEASPEPFQLFQSHRESLDRLYEWEKRLYDEVRAAERLRLSYEKKCAQLRSQDANGAEPFAIERTRIAMRDLRTKLKIALTSVDAVSRRVSALRDHELLPQLAQLIRGLAGMWRVIAAAHRVMKRTADEASALLSSSSAAAAAAGGTRGPPPPPGQTRAAAAAGALATELRAWRAATEAWAESQRGYAAALWGWARSCVKDDAENQDQGGAQMPMPMPRLLVAWARAVETVDVEAASWAVEAVAAEASAIATAARRRRGAGEGEEEETSEEEGKRRVCAGLAAALAAIAEAGGVASAAYGELVAEMEEGDREGEMAGGDDGSIQNDQQ